MQSARQLAAHRACVLLACVPLMCMVACLSASADRASEYALKAVLLRQLVNHVDWPSNAPTSICIVGEDPFGPTLDRAFGALRPRLRRLSANSAELPGCGLVFVAGSEAGVVRALVGRVGQRGTLSVSDLPGFTDEGGMIAMRMQDNRVKFRIDLAQTRRAGLRVNAKLLRLSEIVGKDEVNAP